MQFFVSEGAPKKDGGPKRGRGRPKGSTGAGRGATPKKPALKKGTKSKITQDISDEEDEEIPGSFDEDEFEDDFE